jgi:hypothetical protein
VESTETQVNDGTIESAIAKLIQPEVKDADYEEEDQEEPEQEPEKSQKMTT